ncbi:hypothetical protein [Actinophytocola sediminis]
MKLRTMAAALLGAVGLLVAPAGVAQASPAATSACAPTAEDAWVGTFNGPHVYNSGSVADRVVEVEHNANGQLVIRRDGFVPWGYTDTGLLRTQENHPIVGLETVSATCDAAGDVVAFAGDWYFFYNWPECWGCVVWGTFDVARV